MVFSRSARRLEHQVHQNRLLKIAREGGQITPSDLLKFEQERRYATLVALAIEGTATVTDEVIDLHDRIVGKLFNAARDRAGFGPDSFQLNRRREASDAVHKAAGVGQL